MDCDCRLRQNTGFKLTSWDKTHKNMTNYHWIYGERSWAYGWSCAAPSCIPSPRPLPEIWWKLQRAAHGKGELSSRRSEMVTCSKMWFCENLPTQWMATIPGIIEFDCTWRHLLHQEAQENMNKYVQHFISTTHHIILSILNWCLLTPKPAIGAEAVGVSGSRPRSLLQFKHPSMFRIWKTYCIVSNMVRIMFRQKNIKLNCLECKKQLTNLKMKFRWFLSSVFSNRVFWNADCPGLSRGAEGRQVGKSCLFFARPFGRPFQVSLFRAFVSHPSGGGFRCCCTTRGLFRGLRAEIRFFCCSFFLAFMLRPTWNKIAAPKATPQTFLKTARRMPCNCLQHGCWGSLFRGNFWSWRMLEPQASADRGALGGRGSSPVFLAWAIV